MKKKLRPKGCGRTITGRHIPKMRIEGGSYSPTPVFYCDACGKIDDTNKFADYLYPDQDNEPKIDDTELDANL